MHVPVCERISERAESIYRNRLYRSASAAERNEFMVELAVDDAIGEMFGSEEFGPEERARLIHCLHLELWPGEHVRAITGTKSEIRAEALRSIVIEELASRVINNMGEEFFATEAADRKELARAIGAEEIYRRLHAAGAA